MQLRDMNPGDRGIAHQTTFDGEEFDVEVEVIGPSDNLNHIDINYTDLRGGETVQLNVPPQFWVDEKLS